MAPPPMPVFPAPAPAMPMAPPPVPIQPVTDDYVLQCTPATMCTRFYGQGVMDIAEFGTFPPCPEFGYVRCLDLGVGPVQEMAPPPMPVFPTQPIPPPVFPQPSFPVIALPPPQNQPQPQAPIIEEAPAPQQELAPLYPRARVYPYLGFRFPLVTSPYTTFGAPLGGVYGAPIPSRIGQYGFNGLANFGFPLAPLFPNRIY